MYDIVVTAVRIGENKSSEFHITIRVTSRISFKSLFIYIDNGQTYESLI